jgi:MFS family permease
MSVTETNLAYSISVFALAVGPLVMAPLSQVYGRRPIWLCGSVWYVIWNAIWELGPERPYKLSLLLYHHHLFLLNLFFYLLG